MMKEYKQNPATFSQKRSFYLSVYARTLIFTLVYFILFIFVCAYRYKLAADKTKIEQSFKDWVNKISILI